MSVEVLRSRTARAGTDREFLPRWDGLGRDNLEYGDFQCGRWLSEEEEAALAELERAVREMKSRMWNGYVQPINRALRMIDAARGQ